MKKITLLLVMLIGGFPLVNAQNTVEVDANAAFLGYANVFDLPVDGGAFQFGSAWGIPELKTVIDAGAGTITLQPNFNTYADNPTDPFWVNQSTGEGNKIFEGNTYVEDNTLIGSELTFIGGVVSNTIDAAYAVKAFIKVFNADFSVVKEVNTTLVAGQNFSVTYTDVEPEDTFVQYGFQVLGVNANPADEAALGSVVVSATLLGVNDLNAVDVVIYPNPAKENISISANDVLTNVTVFNVLGQRIMNSSPNDLSTNINVSGLQRGIYIVNIETNVGTKTIKFIKD